MLLESFPNLESFREFAKQANVIPVAAKVLADTETPVSVLARFQNSSESMFLFESVEGGERWGRYSFMGTQAKVRVTVFREEVVVRQGIQERRIPHHGKPMDVLRTIMAPYKLASIPGLPKFCGGLVGYFAYEMVHFFEPRVKNKLPGEKPLADLMIPEALLVFDNVQNTLTVMALAFLNPGDNPDHAYEAARAKRDFLLKILETPAPPLVTPPSKRDLEPKPIITEQAFRDKVLKVKEHIACGNIIQCVISQSFVCEVPEDRLGLYRTQRHLNPSPYMYLLRMGGIELIGSSPETMIRLEHKKATLRPIAGTRPRGKTPQEDLALADELLKDEKERAEHLMLVDLGRNELGRVALPGTVQVTDLMIIERYSHVMHLVSNIVADLEDGHDAFDLLPSAFPAGTLSGAPKVRAMEIIAELEETPRGAYGGAVGYISFDGSMDFAICIRTAILEDGRLTLRAGAGIVADSDPETERAETVSKAKSVARALQILKSVARQET
jgi:anthranilate synthase component 1